MISSSSVIVGVNLIFSTLLKPNSSRNAFSALALRSSNVCCMSSCFIAFDAIRTEGLKSCMYGLEPIYEYTSDNHSYSSA